MAFEDMVAYHHQSSWGGKSFEEVDHTVVVKRSQGKDFAWHYRMADQSSVGIEEVLVPMLAEVEAERMAYIVIEHQNSLNHHGAAFLLSLSSFYP